jgi:hypothetical protein
MKEMQKQEIYFRKSVSSVYSISGFSMRHFEGIRKKITRKKAASRS